MLVGCRQGVAWVVVGLTSYGHGTTPISGDGGGIFGGRDIDGDCSVGARMGGNFGEGEHGIWGLTVKTVRYGRS